MPTNSILEAIFLLGSDEILIFSIFLESDFETYLAPELGIFESTCCLLFGPSKYFTRPFMTEFLLTKDPAI